MTAARDRMVAEQLVGRGITAAGVLAAMGRVPRERFVPLEALAEAYCDCACRSTAGRRSASPISWL